MLMPWELDSLETGERDRGEVILNKWKSNKGSDVSEEWFYD